jgi:3-isopropylmalate/(R)-2-methylmalate dehydratase small subunit
MRLTGRAWSFGDNIDTDVMFPGHALRLPIDEASRHLFEAVRPSWSSEVRPGDIVVAGTGLGAGSARPVAALLRHVGVGAVLAESMASLFQRNCINGGLFAAAVPGIAACRDGDRLLIDSERGTVVNETTSVTLSLPAVPRLLLELVEAGGVVARLRAQGYLPPE